MSQYFKEDQYEVIQSNDSVISVNVWADGIVQEATMAKMGQKKYVEDWETLKEIFKNTSKDFTEAKNKMELDDMMIMFNLVNDLNHDNILLSYVNNVLFYDFVASDD